MVPRQGKEISMAIEELTGTLALQILEHEDEKRDELMDFEQDELLRTLKLEQWFPTADPSIPAWCH
jgi:hypothetical protein